MINVVVPASQVRDTVHLFYDESNKRRLSLRFLAWPPGTHWYHGHTGVDYADGLRGLFVVRDAEDPYLGTYEAEEAVLFTEWCERPITRPLAPPYSKPTIEAKAARPWRSCCLNTSVTNAQKANAASASSSEAS